ncbi:MAG: hypothetical protein KDB27_28285, partial [Planctomycetales bacterium]|nr:hypothetical protein [Planctomycetales bacterium]
GNFVSHDSAGQIRWSTKLFNEPATFEIGGVDRVVFGQIARPQPDNANNVRTRSAPANPVVGALNQLSKLFSKPRSPTTPASAKEKLDLGPRVQTLDGNVFYGDIVSLDENWVALTSSRHSDFRIKTSVVERIDGFTSDLSVLFDFVQGFQNASSIGKKRSTDEWESTLGRLSTTAAGANLFMQSTHSGPIQLELVVSAKNRRPDFLVAIGVANSTQSLRSGFSVETWGDRLVAHRQASSELKHVELKTPESSDGTVRLQMFLDPDSGRFAVYSQSTLLGELVDNEAIKSNRGVLLRNNGQELTVHQCRVKSWNGRSTPLAPSDQHVVQLADGKQFQGTVKSISGGNLTIQTGDAQSQSVSLSELDQVVFSQQRDQEAKPRTAGNMRIDYRDGSVISGKYVKTATEGLILQVDNVESPLLAGWANVGRVQCSETSDSNSASANHSAGLIEITSNRIHGRVVPGDANGQIKWQPVSSNVPVTLNLAAQAKVSFDSVAASAIDATLTDQLHLINGDTIPCRLMSIDSESIHVQFADGSQAVVPRETFKGIRRRPNDSYVYRGINDDEIWHASNQNSGAFSLSDGVLEFKQSIFLARNVDLPERACISFDAEWTGDCSLFVGFGADEAHEAVRRMDPNVGYTTEMMEAEEKRGRDFYGEVTLTRAGKALTGRGYLRSSGLTGQMFANNNVFFAGGVNPDQSSSTFTLGDSPTANIDIFVDRPRRQYAVVANGKVLYSWKETARI